MRGTLKNRAETLDLLAEIVRRRGYLVGSHPSPAPIGVVASLSVAAGEFSVPLGMPFRVMKETDRGDWDQQEALIETLCSDAVSREGGPFFYRLMID